jgi:hypothetical protein
LLSYVAGLINSPHIIITVDEKEIKLKYKAMADSFGAKSQIHHTSTVQMHNPSNNEDTNIFLTSKLH